MAALAPTNPPCEFKVHIVAEASGVLSYVRVNGTTTTTIPLNSGASLQANSPYTFYVPVNSGDTIDFQYSVATTFSELIVWELDYTIPSPMPVLGRNWALGSADGPDITVNQTKALGTSGLPVYIRTLGTSDQPDITANQSKGLGTSSLPVYIRPLGTGDNPDVTVNQSKTTNIRPLTISDLPQSRPISQYSSQNVAVTANTNIL